MLKIRYSRKGRKNKPFYRVVVSDSRKDTQANFKEILGFVNPFSKEISLNAERAKYWMSVGAQPSDTVHNLFVSQGIIEEKKKNITSITKKRAGKLAEKQAKAEEEKAAAKEAAEAEAKAKAESEAKTEEKAAE